MEPIATELTPVLGWFCPKRLFTAPPTEAAVGAKGLCFRLTLMAPGLPTCMFLPQTGPMERFRCQEWFYLGRPFLARQAVTQEAVQCSESTLMVRDLPTFITSGLGWIFWIGSIATGLVRPIWFCQATVCTESQRMAA